MTPIPKALPRDRDAMDAERDNAASDDGASDARERDEAPPLTVLLVEDEFLLADSLCASLRFAGYACVVADEVVTALATLADESQQIAIMVADLNLAGSDGAALISAARNQARYAALPVIITSGDLSQAARERARRAGMNDYLLKPISTESLIRAIERWTRAKPR